MNKFGIPLAIYLAIMGMALIAASENNGSSKEDESKVIKLPEPRTDGGIAVEKALKERRSIRSFGKEGMTIDEVSQLLWAAQGITDDQGHRTAPSAMAKYPLQVYLLAKNVTGLPTGVYHYSPQGHNLTIMMQGNIDEYYNATAAFEAWIKTAPAIFVITGDINSLNQMPGQDMSRWIYVEAGAASENLLLEVISLDLACTYTAGFDANKTEALLGLPQGEVPIGILPAGRKA
jgi:SagB-type dehydrogenase family enzyme